MTQSSARAQSIANILYELKRADKLAKYSAVAERAGFSAGAKGRSVLTCLKTVRRDWPHLQWWRAVSDTGLLEQGSEHQQLLNESGYETEAAEAAEVEMVLITALDEKLMSWEEAEAETAEAVEEAD
jgi:alkylated DNA nucleotide flippase Atl1